LGPLAQPIILPILSRFEEFTISMTIMTFEPVRRFSGLKIKLHSSQRIAVGCFEQPHLMSTSDACVILNWHSSYGWARYLNIITIIRLWKLQTDLSYLVYGYSRLPILLSFRRLTLLTDH